MNDINIATVMAAVEPVPGTPPTPSQRYDYGRVRENNRLAEQARLEGDVHFVHAGLGAGVRVSALVALIGPVWYAKSSSIWHILASAVISFGVQCLVWCAVGMFVYWLASMGKPAISNYRAMSKPYWALFGLAALANVFVAYAAMQP